MGRQRGRDVLISIGDDEEPEAFVLIAGIRARTINLTAGLIEATTAQRAQAWREVIAGAGVKRAEVAGAGVFKDAMSDALIRVTFFAGRAPAFEPAIPDFGVMREPVVIVELTYAGDHDGEVTFAIRLASAGVVIFEAEGAD